MMVGAEAIMADGSAIAKVGTYLTALSARQFGVPVYVIVDTMKLNVSSAIGLSLGLDPIARADVLPADAPAKAKVTGALFDSTPAHLIRGIVTERGVIAPAACSALMREMPISQYLCQKLLKEGI
jgi:methylthioribose-1-phosphate isomerase